MNRTVNLAEGIDLLGVDLDGLNEFLHTPPAQGTGLAVLISGDLSPGNASVAIVHGEPIGKIIHDQANGTPLQLAAIVQMTPYFDPRHSEYLQVRLIKEISEARGLTPRDETAQKAMEVNRVPHGDLERMDQAALRLFDEIDDAIGFELFGDTRARKP